MANLIPNRKAWLRRAGGSHACPQVTPGGEGRAAPSAGRVPSLGPAPGDETAGAGRHWPAAQYSCAAAKKKGDGRASGWEGEQGKGRMQTLSQPPSHSVIPSDGPIRELGVCACVRAHALSWKRPEQGDTGVRRLCGTCVGAGEDAKGGRVCLCPDRCKGTCHCHSFPRQDQLTHDSGLMGKKRGEGERLRRGWSKFLLCQGRRNPVQH